MAKLNLDKALSRNTFDHAVICTYTFEAHYFETYALEQLNALASNANISVLLDQGTYDKMLAGGSLERPKRANLRYLLHPIRAARTFHPKLVLLATKSKGLLLVGSANFTRAGLTQNAELVGQFAFEAGSDERFLPLFREAFAFVERLAKEHPSQALSSNLGALAADAPWLLPDAQALPEALPIWLLHNLDTPIWPQLTQGLVSPIQRLDVLSPFFDEHPNLLEQVLQGAKPKTVTIRTQNETTTLTPAWLKHPSVAAGRTKVLFCEYEDDGHRQTLHAKGLALTHEGGVRLAYGSANFTRPALLQTAQEGNVELVLAIDGEARALRPESLFDPTDSGETLGDPSQLVSRPRTPRPVGNPLQVQLAQAEVDGNTLRCQVSFPAPGSVPSGLTAVLDISGLQPVQVPLKPGTADWYGELSQPLVGMLDRESVIATVRADWPGQRTAVSNAVLVINLIELHSGTALRKERRLREAEQNAEQFARVLAELIKAGDDDSLIRFLTLCDIRLASAANRLARQAAKSPWEAPQSMRELGARNLVLFGTLHEATQYFVERHMRRIERHLKAPSLEHVPVFMHIVLAVADVLRTQLERGVLGLELADEPISNDAWYHWRECFDWYSEQYGMLLSIVTQEYMPALKATYSKAEARQALSPDLGPLVELSKTFGDLRGRAAKTFGTTLWVRTPTGVRVTPFVAPSNALGEKKWAPLSAEVRRSVQVLSGWLSAAKSPGPALAGTPS